MSERKFVIYLVDDDVKTLIMYKHQLEKRIEHPLDVHVFAYGENCLDRMEEQKADIIVLDYYLNAIREDAMTGIEVLGKIKAMSPQTEVIMISGQEDMETAIQCIRNGAYDYIIKNEKAMLRLELVVNKILYQNEKKA